MGGCASTAIGGRGTPYIVSNDGGEPEFHARYVEGRILGEGEFGAVKLCTDKTTTSSGEELAVKILKKGMVFKDNTLYGALKPKVLQAECIILKTLDGKNYCLELKGIYETPKVIYVVTELCSGGEMGSYVSKHPELRTEDVSRISHQLLSAVNHCASHNIIHRDIKADNCMFVSNSPTAELRLIDFGCGVHDSNAAASSSKTDLTQHTTFAGSAFYISPEMFQHTYTSATDVFSAGVTLYVLVAGYPADELQKAFNILQKSKASVRTLPNLPPNLPESYYEMLEKLCTYHHKSRPSAREMLQDEFVQFHKVHEKEASSPSTTTAASSSKKMKRSRTASVHFVGSVERHGLVLNYQKFERAVTTLLATMLSREQLEQVLATLEHRDGKTKLKVISVGELKTLLVEMDKQECVDMIDNFPNSSGYGSFAYHIALLKQFSRLPPKDSSSGERRAQRSISISAGTMPKSNDLLQTNILAATLPPMTKQNGTTLPTQKSMRSQSVMVTSKPAARSQSVFGNAKSFKPSNDLADLQSFKPPMTSLKKGMALPVGREKTPSVSFFVVEEGEYDC